MNRINPSTNCNYYHHSTLPEIIRKSEDRNKSGFIEHCNIFYCLITPNICFQWFCLREFYYLFGRSLHEQYIFSDGVL